MNKKIILSIVCCLFAAMTSAQIKVSKQAPSVEQNFDSMGDGLQLPDSWRVEANTSAPRRIGDYADARTSVHFTASTNISSSASNGAYNFASSSNPSDRAVGGISTDAVKGNNTRCTNVMVMLSNVDTEYLNELTVSYDVEKYRYGKNSAGFTVQMYFSTDGKSWHSAGDDFKTYFPKDSKAGGADVVPISTQSVKDQKLQLSVASGKALYLAWNISASSGSQAFAAQALAIDNVSLLASFGKSNLEYKVIIQPDSVVLVPTVPDKVKVLSMNNSLIEYNKQYNVFNNIAKAMGKDAKWVNHTMLGQNLMTHYNSSDGKAMATQDKWTHIILQEHSTLPRTDFESFKNDVATWVKFIRNNCPNPNAIIILPMNWALYENQNSFANFQAHNAKLYENYVAVAREYGVTICPVGLAYEKIYEGEGADYTATLFSDNRHPTPKATYLAACMEYSLIFGIDPTTITYVSDGVSDTDAQLLRKYAKTTLDEFTNIVDHIHGKVNYTTTVTDQFGDVVESDEPFEYSVDGGGYFDGNVFNANGVAGSYTVHVSRGDDVSADAKIKVVNNDTSTGVSTVQVEDDKARSANLYNISGQRVSKSYKGIVIGNRKKYVNIK